MPNLKDDPAVAKLLEKELAKAAASSVADTRRALKDLGRSIKETVDDFSKAAKETGDKTGVAWLKKTSAAVSAAVKEATS